MDYRIYPLETHIAEKLHAYTLPRERPNSRVKDLPDIALLATAREIKGAELKAAIDKTFAHRGTHPVPDRVPDPPDAWGPVYERMAGEDGLSWRSLEDVTAAVREFVDAVLTSTPDVWNPHGWTW